MKKYIILLLAVVLPVLAYGYSSQVGLDPSTSSEIEYKSVFKSNTAGWSDAVTSGDLLTYTTDLDGYTVTRVGSALGVYAQKQGGAIACVADRAIASGSATAVPCVTKGGKVTVNYSVTAPAWINAGENLCANNAGQAINCGVAASNSGVVSLETVNAAGTGTIKAVVNAR